jgi:putative PIN family toxin of toxin-antitoxin system
MMMRAVLDANVLVSAVLSRAGLPATILVRWLGGDFELIVSPLLVDELARVLAYPKIAARVTAQDAAQFVHLLGNGAVLLDDPPDPPPVRSRDGHDDYLVALARSASAVIVTGDADLLSLGPRIPVFTPAQFTTMLDQRP